jgi:hypothetical protein
MANAVPAMATTMRAGKRAFFMAGSAEVGRFEKMREEKQGACQREIPRPHAARTAVCAIRAQLAQPPDRRLRKLCPSFVR